MRSGRLLVGSVLVLLSVPGFAYSHSRRGPTAPRSFSKRSSKSTSRPVGQRSIDDGRATEIQSALGSAGYLQGEPSGHWDSSTEAAMQRFQADNGWQTKLIPDSRAIIKLGLGPHNGSDLLAEPGTTTSESASAFRP